MKQSAQQKVDQSVAPLRYPNRFRPGQSGNPLGRRSPAVRAREEEAERQVEVKSIRADLGREPSALERLLIDELAALAVRARKLRRVGKPTDDVARLMSRIVGQLGICPREAAPPALSFDDLAADVAERRAAALADEEG